MKRLPPGQQLAAAGKWPIIGEKLPSEGIAPWSIAVTGEVGRPATWTVEELAALPRVRRSIDIHCVTRWSKLEMAFDGVLLAEVVGRSAPTAAARFVSFVAQSDRNHSSSLPLAEAIELETMLALRCDGEPLATEHGGPVRIVVPGRYFYKSVKWVRRLDLLSEDRLGYWESQAGYHNRANPWREERYLAPGLTRQEMQAVLTSRDFSGRDFSGRDLRSIEASGRELVGLKAAGARLRDARFERCDLRDADFSGANLSNATFRGADLRGARFIGADVEGAEFAGADLRAADFSEASLVAATFCSEGEHRARIDATTRFDRPSLDDLMPDQSAFVRRWLGIE